MKRDELLGLLQARDSRAVRHVLGALRRAGGNVLEASAALGLGARTLYRHRDRIPELRRGFDRFALGRAGGARLATEARLEKTS